jgi:glutamate-ammonia-ligase adenylyltransferase
MLLRTAAGAAEFRPADPMSGQPVLPPAGAEATLAALRAAAPRARAASAWLRRVLAAVEGAAPPVPALDWLLECARLPWGSERLAACYRQHRAAPAGGAVEAGVARALRRTRRELLCGLLLRDAAGLAPLEEVTGAMTDFAELAVGELLRVLAPELARTFGTPLDGAGVPQDLLVLAMGKAGARELNVSSDLDLIFVYGEVTQCRRADAPGGAAAPAVDGQEFFDRLGRRLIGALDTPDADGFVFRIDMRLRPHGDAGPLVVSLAMLEEYLLREGREWERFAWAKARVISPPVLADAPAHARQCAALEALVQPFVYRKYFDFGAIGAIRDLHRRIGAEARRRNGAGARGADVKLGRGGIREIEFLAQTYSIMRGGRDHRLRARGTVATLGILAQLGLLAPAEAQRLAEDYRFLRRLEHALQYRADAQTHLLPVAPAELDEVAQLLDLPAGADLLARYQRVSDEVARSFDGLFPPGASAPGPGAPAPALDLEALQAAGCAEPVQALARLHGLLGSVRLAGLSAPARAALERLAGHALQLIGARARSAAPVGGAGADELLLRWIRLVEVIGRRSTYFALLDEYPRAHERVLGLLAAGGWPTEYLLRHPILLDELVDLRPQRFAEDRRLDELAPVPGAAEPYWLPWRDETAELLRACDGDVERQMNLLRDAHHAQVFRLLLADLAGELQLEHLADHLSALADAVLYLALGAAWRSLEAARGEALPPRLAIIAYGKLGGRELGYASDLDLAFVFDEGEGAAAVEHNTTLATALVRRLLSWLSSVTSSGTLFEIDLRLRPNGNAGLLVTPIGAFDRYQTNADGHGAWVWEHQALTRARACAGDPALGAQVERLRARVLAQPREPAALAAEVVAMRLRMLEGHANRSGRFDLKHDRGGMVDIEFTVQYLVLAHAHRHAALLANRGNIGLLAIAGALGLVDAALARDCAAAYRRYRRLQHGLRLNGQEHARVEGTLVAAEIASVRALWRAVLGTDAPQAPAAQRAAAR